eukprot:6575421-Pyramimonas_sp.AAC.1
MICVHDRLHSHFEPVDSVNTAAGERTALELNVPCHCLNGPKDSSIGKKRSRSCVARSLVPQHISVCVGGDGN